MTCSAVGGQAAYLVVVFVQDSCFQGCADFARHALGLLQRREARDPIRRLPLRHQLAWVGYR